MKTTIETGRIQQIQNELSEKIVGAVKKDLFNKNFSIFKNFFNSECSTWILFLAIWFKKSTNVNKYIKTTKFGKPVISTPLKTIPLNGSQ